MAEPSSKQMNRDLSANTTLSHYRIVCKLGAGGMGEVYLAQDTKLDRKVALKIVSQAYIAKGMYAEAIALDEQWLQTDPMSQFALRDVGIAYARSGRQDKAEEMISRFKEIAKKQYAMSCRIASIYAALGEKEKAFAELEKAFAERDWDLHRLKVDPFMDPLRADPRFAALVRRVGLPQGAETK